MQMESEAGNVADPRESEVNRSGTWTWFTAFATVAAALRAGSRLVPGYTLLRSCGSQAHTRVQCQRLVDRRDTTHLVGNRRQLLHCLRTMEWRQGDQGLAASWYLFETRHLSTHLRGCRKADHEIRIRRRAPTGNRLRSNTRQRQSRRKFPAQLVRDQCR